MALTTPELAKRLGTPMQGLDLWIQQSGVKPLNPGASPFRYSERALIDAGILPDEGVETRPTMRVGAGWLLPLEHGVAALLTAAEIAEATEATPEEVLKALQALQIEPDEQGRYDLDQVRAVLEEQADSVHAGDGDPPT